MNEYHFSRLDRKEQAYYRKMLEAVKRGDSSIKPSLFIDGDAISKIASAINYDHPELFYVDFRHLSFMITPMGTVYNVNYLVKSSLRSLFERELEDRISSILNLATQRKLKGAYEKCRWIHDYLVRNIRYNHEALKRPDEYPDSFSIKGVFMDGLAVCEGISKAFKLLCDRIGDVDASVVFGTSSQDTLGLNIPHAWNVVTFNGNYVHIDVTWDIGLSESSRYTRYDYFCVSDRWMKEDHVYDIHPVCATDAYSYFSKRGRAFSKGKELQSYIDTEMKKGSTVLYFKVDTSQADLDAMQLKINSQVSNGVLANVNSGYRLELVPNIKQQCFFYRIKQ